MTRDGIFYLKGLEGMTDDEFFRFCQDNPDLRLERNSHGEIVITSPTGTLSGNRSGRIFGALYVWNEEYRLGEVFDSSTGFRLPDGSVLSPDAAWVPRATWEALSREEQEKFAPVCPAFLVELKSPSDSLRALQEKMLVWIENGTRLAWLIDPGEERAHIYRADGRRDVIDGFDNAASGEDVLPDFKLELGALR